MTSYPPLLARAEERIDPATRGAEGGLKSGWAALGSLLIHGTALAAALIAASGSGPQAPPPAIEVSVVMAAAPQAGTAASKGEAVEQAAAPREATPSESQESRTAPTASIRKPTPMRRADPEQEALAVLEPAPVLPTRKPEPSQPSESAEVRGHAPQAVASPPQPTPSDDASASATQLAVLPANDNSMAADAIEGGATTPPTYQAGGSFNPWPRYPTAARRRGIEGEVLIAVTVGADGGAEHVEVLRSSGHSMLDRAAIEALARWRFEPARNAGQAVAGTIEIPVTFRLTDPGGS
ncbi:MAG TPA: energy transducer TonB [Alphaproteobacteria bacterium]|nr:energy transducer TonB [Alphaproteobacteria bacterium]